MIWKLIADLITFFHVFWILAVILGPFWALRHKFIRIIHIIILWVTFLVGVSGRYCPFTFMENSLRMRYNPSSGYSGGFISYYFDRLISWDPGREAIVWAIVMWTLLWSLIYIFLWIRKSKKVSEILSKNKPPHSI